MIHRDIKPGNIFVSDQARVKVLDFGLARRLPTASDDPHGMEGSTIPGRPLGTASYMAPERILQLPLDARSDLFSLGVVIYEMATGRLPFTGASTGETVTNILDKPPAAADNAVARPPESAGEDCDKTAAQGRGRPLSVGRGTAGRSRLAWTPLVQESARSGSRTPAPFVACLFAADGFVELRPSRRPPVSRLVFAVRSDHGQSMCI